jgi:intracellular multiplication protein IcmL
MEPKDALVLIYSRNSFYKRLHFLVLGAFAISLFVIFILIWTLVFLLNNPTRPVYFATDDVSRLVQIVPVNTPNMSMDEVIDWTIEAVRAAYSYDYINYRSQLQNSQKYFTNYGWRTYMQALSASNNLLALTTRKQIILANVIEKPELEIGGILNGAYAWKFNMPVLITYYMPPYDGSSQSQFSNALNVSIIVQRQQILEGYKGLGVVQLVSEFATTATTNQPQQISSSPAG